MSRISKTPYSESPYLIVPESFTGNSKWDFEILTKKSFISINILNFLPLIISKIKSNCSNRFKTYYYPKYKVLDLYTSSEKIFFGSKKNRKFFLNKFFFGKIESFSYKSQNSHTLFIWSISLKYSVKAFEKSPFPACWKITLKNDIKCGKLAFFVNFFCTCSGLHKKMRKTQSSLKSDSESISHITLLQSSQKTSILENWGQKI